MELFVKKAQDSLKAVKTTEDTDALRALLDTARQSILFAIGEVMTMEDQANISKAEKKLENLYE
jgi:hypothetical protein